MATWKEFKEQIRDAVDFPSLVAETITLSRQPHGGRPMMVYCPFHDDRATKSLAVYADHVTCYGACHETWDCFGWLMKRDGLTFPQARDELARRAGIPKPHWPPEQEAAAQERREYEDALGRVARHFVSHLQKAPAALAYARGRAWSDEVIRAEGVGYANSESLPDLGNSKAQRVAETLNRDVPNFDPVVVRSHDINATGPFTEPVFSAVGWYPTIPLSLNRLGFLKPEEERWKISLVMGQYHSEHQVERLFDRLAYAVYFDALGSSDFVGPEISNITAATKECGNQLTVGVSDSSGVYRVLATWTANDGTWQSEDLQFNEESGEWQGTISASDQADILIQAMDNIGNITVDNNDGLYYSVGLLGDVNGDCKVDITDIQAVASRWRISCDDIDPDSNPYTPNFESCYDLDCDCDIDIVDIMKVVAHWAETCK